PWKRLIGSIEFNMPAQHIADRAIFDEIGNSLCARPLGLVIVKEKPPWHQKVTRQQQACIAVEKHDVGCVMAGSRYHIYGSVAQFDLRDTVRPIDEVVVLANAVKVPANHLNIGQIRELTVARTMVTMPMRVNHEQRQSRFPTSGQ